MTFHPILGESTKVSVFFFFFFEETVTVSVFVSKSVFSDPSQYFRDGRSFPKQKVVIRRPFTRGALAKGITSGAEVVWEQGLHVVEGLMDHITRHVQIQMFISN
jgi:hypothetical protein